MRASELFAMAHGKACTGDHQCFWCGAPAHAVGGAPAGFTNWSEVAAPSSRYICTGCQFATDESDRAKRPRMMSWLITRALAISAGKGQIDTIRGWCLQPPEPPFVLAISTSGQKHTIYRAPVNHDVTNLAIQFETQRVMCDRSSLASRLDLCMRICAATGKPALAESPRSNLTRGLASHFENFDDLLIWHEIWAEPLSRLCAFLCPKKEICLERHPSQFTPIATPADPNLRRRRVAAEAGRADGPGLFGP